MSPAVLVMLTVFKTGAAAVVPIDMPSMAACEREMQRINTEYQVDTSSRCIDRRPATRGAK